jgi:ribonuclease HII
MPRDPIPSTASGASVRGPAPTLRTEKKLFREGHRLLAACDEVGRGALSGPATVGVVLVDQTVTRPLRGLRDSKLLLPPAREALVPRIRRWVVDHAVGHATAAEVDEYGIIAAMRIAAGRALAALSEQPDVVLLDGNYDYLTPPSQRASFGTQSLFPELDFPRVVTQIKADVTCSSVAAASVLAKCARDAIMVDLAATCSHYGWEINKGYATPEHLEAIRRYGCSEQHRQSWRLPLQVLDLPPGEALIDIATEMPAESVAAVAQALAAVGENDPREASGMTAAWSIAESAIQLGNETAALVDAKG